MLELQHITKFYSGNAGVCALDDLNLTVADGEFLSVIGSSGSGKTTLMNIMGCLDAPTSGRYFLDAQDVHKLKSPALAKVRNSKIGFIFQGFNLIPTMSALENVELPLVLRGMKASERRSRAKEALSAVSLDERALHLPSQLSGGQKQRVAIARVLAADPKIILADEPTGNLDLKAGREVMEIISAIHGQGRTVVLITHDMAVAARAQRVVRIENGILSEA